jgi:fructokinase
VAAKILINIDSHYLHGDLLSSARSDWMQTNPNLANPSSHATPHVICLGEVLQDCLAAQIGVPLAEVISWNAYFGGAPANVACGLVKLGIPTAFVGCIGKDSAGEDIQAYFEQIGVNTSGLQHHPSRPTRQVLITRTTSGDRQFAAFADQLPTDAFADTELQAAALPEALFAQARFLVMGSLGLASPVTAAAMQAALKLAQQRQLHIVIDVNWRPIFWSAAEPEAKIQSQIKTLLLQAQIIKLTDEEALWLFDTSSPAAIAEWWQQQQPEPHPPLWGVLVTAGEKGCAYWLGGHTGQVPALPVTVVDTTGAGDSFLAGFLSQLCKQGPAAFANSAAAQATVTYASAVAALTTTQAGAVTSQPDAKTVEAWLVKLG